VFRSAIDFLLFLGETLMVVDLFSQHTSTDSPTIICQVALANLLHGHKLELLKSSLI